MIQSLILLFGASAIALIQSRSERVQFYGFVCGVMSEPLWLYEAWRTEQWGVVILAVWWGFYYAMGAWKRRCCFVPDKVE